MASFSDKKNQSPSVIDAIWQFFKYLIGIFLVIVFLGFCTFYIFALIIRDFFVAKFKNIKKDSQ